jgi:phosphoribosylpyrophosphate synthetase
LIDDVIATGVTLVTAAKLIQKYEASVTIIGLTYGSVYK